MLKIGDFVRVNYPHCPMYHGKTGIIIGYKADAKASATRMSPGYPVGGLYAGFFVSPAMRNSNKLNICWLPEHLEKINPPDVDLKVEEEKELDHTDG